MHFFNLPPVAAVLAIIRGGQKRHSMARLRRNNAATRRNHPELRQCYVGLANFLQQQTSSPNTATLFLRACREWNPHRKMVRQSSTSTPAMPTSPSGISIIRTNRLFTSFISVVRSDPAASDASSHVDSISTICCYICT